MGHSIRIHDPDPEWLNPGPGKRVIDIDARDGIGVSAIGWLHQRLDGDAWVNVAFVAFNAHYWRPDDETMREATIMWQQRAAHFFVNGWDSRLPLLTAAPGSAAAKGAYGRARLFRAAWDVARQFRTDPGPYPKVRGISNHPRPAISAVRTDYAVNPWRLFAADGTAIHLGGVEGYRLKRDAAAAIKAHATA